MRVSCRFDRVLSQPCVETRVDWWYPFYTMLRILTFNMCNRENATRRPVRRRASRNFWWGDDMDEEKIGMGLGATVGPQRGPGAEPLVGVKGAKPPIKITLFHELNSDFALSK
jgi:hypothetical protein